MRSEAGDRLIRCNKFSQTDLKYLEFNGSERGSQALVIEFLGPGKYGQSLPGEREITELLHRWSDGDSEAREALIELTYPQLRNIARNRLRGEPGAVSLDSTGLAHEAFEKLIGQQTIAYESRGHFFAIVARTMRRLMVDKHRARTARKRGGEATFVSLTVAEPASPVIVDLEFLNRALDLLAEQDSRQAQVVEMRFFAGLTIDETAEALGISPTTVKREWVMARAYLKRELRDES